MVVGRKELLKQFKTIVNGKRILFSLANKYNINWDMDFVVVMPESDLNINILILIYLNLLVRQFEENKDNLERCGQQVMRENERFLVLTKDERLVHDAKILFPRLNDIVILDDFDMQAIMTRYCFMPIKDRLVMASIHELNGINYMGLLNKTGITLDEIIAVAVLGVNRRNFIKWKIPKIDTDLIENEDVLELILNKEKSMDEKKNKRLI